jgi:hypothetical protein
MTFLQADVSLHGESHSIIDAGETSFWKTNEYLS